MSASSAAARSASARSYRSRAARRGRRVRFRAAVFVRRLPKGFCQQRLEARQTLPVVADGRPDHSRPFLGGQFRHALLVLGRRQQPHHPALVRVGQLDQVPQAGEPLDGPVERSQGIALCADRTHQGPVVEGREHGPHGFQGAFEQRNGFPCRGNRACGLRSAGVTGRQVDHRLHLPQDAPGPRRRVLLPVAQVTRREPRRRLALQSGLHGDLRVVECRQRLRVGEHRQLVPRDRLQHGHGIQQLLAGALEFRERRVAAPVRPFTFQAPQAPARVAQGLAGALQVFVQALELQRPRALLRRHLLLPPRFDVCPLFRRQVGNVRGFGKEGTLTNGQGLESVPEPRRIGPRPSGLDCAEQPPQPVPDTALVVDDPVQPGLQPIALVQLVGELLNAAQDHLQVDAGVLVTLGRQAHGVVEPRRTVAQPVDRVRRRAGGSVGLSGQRDPEVERRPVAQLRVRTGRVAGCEKPVRRDRGRPGLQLLQRAVVPLPGTLPGRLGRAGVRVHRRLRAGIRRVHHGGRGGFVRRYRGRGQANPRARDPAGQSQDGQAGPAHHYGPSGRTGALAPALPTHTAPTSASTAASANQR